MLGRIYAAHLDDELVPVQHSDAAVAGRSSPLVSRAHDARVQHRAVVVEDHETAIAHQVAVGSIVASRALV
jgi:hypothetical protein